METSATEHSPTTAPVTEDAHGDHDFTYLIVFVALAALTGLELLATYLPAIKIPLLIGFAAAKAILVVAFYMHLRWEKRILPMIFATPVIIGILVALALQQLVLR